MESQPNRQCHQDVYCGDHTAFITKRSVYISMLPIAIDAVLLWGLLVQC